ncbi:unnamed protein product [Adineta steineri]|uniref:Uncharacterized protein n=1 Tax=Adineta steineri TaxID=433720 RepID=A0A813QMZ1_9BILA|nr:unnamed protein product [Adineta steineri]CAF3649277.1 unnamed protein product [Adineta steineri]
MAYELNQWLNKRATISHFDIGLEPTLLSPDLHEQNECERITRYAAYDCLAIHQFLSKLKSIPNHQLTTGLNERVYTTTDDTQLNELYEQERKKIHNRSCTIKQHRRYYRNELIFKDIDQRFTLKQIKTILKQHQIPVYIVNTS